MFPILSSVIIPSFTIVSVLQRENTRRLLAVEVLILNRLFVTSNILDEVPCSSIAFWTQDICEMEYLAIDQRLKAQSFKFGLPWNVNIDVCVLCVPCVFSYTFRWNNGSLKVTLDTVQENKINSQRRFNKFYSRRISVNSINPI